MLKRKVPVEIIARGLFKYLEDESNMENMLSDIDVSERANVRLELKLLSVFVIDYGAYEVLGDTPNKKALLDAFYALLRIESERFFGISFSIIFPKILDRLSEYAKALKTPHNMGPMFVLGKTFSSLCGKEKDLDLTFKGSLWFQAGLQFLPLREYLKKYEIEI